MIPKDLRAKVSKLLAERYNISLKHTPSEAEMRKEIEVIVRDIASRENVSLDSVSQAKLIDELINELLGLGPLKSLLEDPTVTEIMINGPYKIYIERSGKKMLSDVTFDSEQHLLYTIHKILGPTRRHVDEMSPYVDASLPDGSRVNIVLAPLSLQGPVVTIRKFLGEIHTVDDLVRRDTLSEKMAQLLVAAIKAKLNIVFSGATGAGKTTTLNILSQYIPKEERIITIEDTAELHLMQDHVVKMETRQPNIEGKGEITIRDLFRNSLRMRPDRIILGEIRGQEALDMLQAISSGHTGSLAVIHANSPLDVLSRLETMIYTSHVTIPLWAVRRQIAQALDLIVQQEQLVDGSRKITHITEVGAVEGEEIVLRELFSFEQEGIDAHGKVKGHWKVWGIKPTFLEKFNKLGIRLADSVFIPE